MEARSSDLSGRPPERGSRLPKDGFGSDQFVESGAQSLELIYSWLDVPTLDVGQTTPVYLGFCGQ
jgi:hypothetical protein